MCTGFGVKFESTLLVHPKHQQLESLGAVQASAFHLNVLDNSPQSHGNHECESDI